MHVFCIIGGLSQVQICGSDNATCPELPSTVIFTTTLASLFTPVSVQNLILP